MFAVTTLTCNDRNTIFKTIAAFVLNTDISKKIDWFIFAQGCSEPFLASLKKLTEKIEAEKNVQFHLTASEKNLGLSKGSNVLAEQTKDYKYVLNLEDDWILLGKDVTNIEKEWLDLCLQFLEEDEKVSTLFLRKYHDSGEKARYGWSKGIPYQCHKHKDNFNWKEKMKGSLKVYYHGIIFQEIPHFLFTFNPCIRRNEDYYNANVFPLQEFDDVNTIKEKWTDSGDKNIPHWGWCEALTMEKTYDLTTFNVGAGLFGHFEDWF